MQQDPTEMQRVEQLSQVRSFPFGAYRQDLHHVEKLIIDKYLGIPYKHRGRTMEGLDCWGFLKLVYADLGFRLFDIEDLEYGQAWGLRNKDYFKENYANDWERAAVPRALDGVLFLNSHQVVNHAGIVLSSDRFIHCARQGVIISRLNEPRWLNRIEGFYRLKT